MARRTLYLKSQISGSPRRAWRTETTAEYPRCSALVHRDGVGFIQHDLDGLPNVGFIQHDLDGQPNVGFIQQDPDGPPNVSHSLFCCVVNNPERVVVNFHNALQLV